MVSGFESQLASRLTARQDQHLYRRRKTIESAQNTEVVISGKKFLSFCSNDYLGLANHPDIIKSFKNAVDEYGLGSGASHLITGHSSPHHALEEELAEFTGRSRALLFSSGYMANVGVLTTLLERHDVVLEDRLNHASLLDGGIFSAANFKRYSHLDTKKLTEIIDKLPKQKRLFIVSDGVFSMDGDQAKLMDLVKLSEKNKAFLMIDDAHGFGCLGNKGGGIVEQYQESGNNINEDNLQVLVGTFGKAFGTSGAFVAGSETLIEGLIQFCRPYVYTTALPPALAVATSKSLAILQKETWRREYLASLIERFRTACKSLGFTLLDSITPIQAIVFGDVEKTMEASRILESQGIIVSAIRPPTVPLGSARLRFTFSAAHTEAQFQCLIRALKSMAPLISEVK